MTGHARRTSKECSHNADSVLLLLLSLQPPLPLSPKRRPPCQCPLVSPSSQLAAYGIPAVSSAVSGSTRIYIQAEAHKAIDSQPIAL
jgi:hypothetical protein